MESTNRGTVATMCSKFSERVVLEVSHMLQAAKTAGMEGGSLT